MTLTEIQLRRDTAANWTTNNPVLADGEPGYETDTGKIKIGNGTSSWTSLAYDFLTVSTPAGGALSASGPMAAGRTSTLALPVLRSFKDVMDYGAKFDVASGTGSMAATGNVLTDAAGPFTTADVGKAVTIPTAGNSAGTSALYTTFSAYISATQMQTTSASLNTSAISGVAYTYGTDDAPAWRLAVGASGINYNGTLWAPAGGSYLNSTDGSGFCVGIAPNATNVKVIGQGAATRIVTSGNCKRFIDLARTADYQTLQNVTLEHFTVDGNNAGGPDHLIIGTLANGWWQTRVNVANISVRWVNTVNVSSNRQSISLGSAHAAANEATQTTLQGIYVGWCSFSGGRYGVTIYGVGTTGSGLSAGVNAWIDNTRIHDLSHDVGVTPTADAASTTVQLGSLGFGGFDNFVWAIRSWNVTDVMIEIDCIAFCLVRDSIAFNSWATSFFVTSFHNPLYAAWRVVFEECRAVLTIDAAFPRFGTHAQATSATLTNNSLGDVEYIHCGVEINKANLGTGFSLGDVIGAGSNTSVTPMLALVIDDFRISVEGFNYNSASATTWTICALWFPISPTVAPQVSIRGLRFYINGAQGGTGGLTVRYVGIDGTAIIDASALRVAHTITGQTGTTRLLDLAQLNATNVKGTVRDYSVAQFTGGTVRGLNLQATATIPSAQLRFYDCDWSAATAGSVDANLAGTGGANVKFFNHNSAAGTGIVGQLATFNNYVINATTTFTPVAGTYRVEMTGGGGGGAGAGSALTAGGVANQAGGGGGASGGYTVAYVTLDGVHSVTATIGAAATGGAGGAVNGNPGVTGSSGADATLVGTTAGVPSGGVTAKGGGNGKPSVANSATAGQGGSPAGAPNTAATTSALGQGGAGGSAGVGGVGLAGGSGGGGGAAGASLGGGGAGAGGIGTPGAVGAAAASASAAGVNGATTTAPGAGGGGGGGGAPGGAGGSGGGAGPGQIALTQVA